MPRLRLEAKSLRFIYQNPFAEAEVTDQTGLEGEGFHDPTKNNRACHDDIFPARLQACHGQPLWTSFGEEVLLELFDR